MKKIIYSPGTQEESAKVVHGIAAADASWYYMSELGNDILSFPSLLRT